MGETCATIVNGRRYSAINLLGIAGKHVGATKVPKMTIVLQKSKNPQPYPSLARILLQDKHVPEWDIAKIDSREGNARILGGERKEKKEKSRRKALQNRLNP